MRFLPVVSLQGERRVPLPVTVIGGYLGAGKTTLLNALLQNPGGRRLGVIVNDFGELGVDASLLASTDGASMPVANLSNGCVCCTLGDDLGTTLAEMSQLEPALDHIVIEASGVADPASAAAWGTVAPFVPGGTIVLAAADHVQRMARDRYVGGEVRRQLEGADLLLVTKTDLVPPEGVDRVVQWLATLTAAPCIDAQQGDVGADIVLGVRATDPGAATAAAPSAADHRYVRWSWTSNESVALTSVEAFLADLPPGLLRLKGVVDVRVGDDTSAMLIQVVGSTVSVTPSAHVSATGIEAIGIRDVFDRVIVEESALKYLRSS